MAGSFNSVVIVGNVGKEPDVKTFQDGNKVANFSIATSESWKDKQTGEKKERTDWHNIAVRNQGLIAIVQNYVKKGSKVLIQGQLSNRKYTDNSGTEKYITEIVLGPFNSVLTLLGDKPGGGGDARANGGTNARTAPAGGGSFDRDLDDEVPFATIDPEMEPSLRRRVVA